MRVLKSDYYSNLQELSLEGTHRNKHSAPAVGASGLNVHPTPANSPSSNIPRCASFIKHVK